MVAATRSSWPRRTRPASLSRTAGVLALHSLDVRVGVDPHPRRDGRQPFVVEPRFGTVPERRDPAQRPGPGARGTSRSPTAGGEGAGLCPRRHAPAVAPTVHWLDDAATDATVLELRTTTPSVCCFRVTAALERCGVDIRSARVSSLGRLRCRRVLRDCGGWPPGAGRFPQTHRGGAPADLACLRGRSPTSSNRPAPFGVPYVPRGGRLDAVPGVRRDRSQTRLTGRIGVGRRRCEYRPGRLAGNVRVVSRANDVRRGLRRISPQPIALPAARPPATERCPWNSPPCRLREGSTTPATSPTPAAWPSSLTCRAGRATRSSAHAPRRPAQPRPSGCSRGRAVVGRRRAASTVQIPDAFLRDVSGLPARRRRRYAIGIAFLPVDP